MIAPVTFAAFLQLDLPSGTVRMVDGGTLTYLGQTFTARDPLLGVPGQFEAVSEGVGDETPAGTITFYPPDEAGSAALIAPETQNARLRLWVGELNEFTGTLKAAPMQLVDWLLDVPSLRLEGGRRSVEYLFVGSGERLFQIDRGNSLSSAFHEAVHPGEMGLRNATGLESSVPWGAPSPPRGLASYGSGTVGGGSWLDSSNTRPV